MVNEDMVIEKALRTRYAKRLVYSGGRRVDSVFEACILVCWLVSCGFGLQNM